VVQHLSAPSNYPGRFTGVLYSSQPGWLSSGFQEIDFHKHTAEWPKQVSNVEKAAKEILSIVSS
jgi:hypothetical protein